MNDEQKKKTEAMHWELHQEVLESIKKRLSREKVSASDIANAIKFLRDNRITIDEVEDTEYVRPSWSDRLDLPFPLEKGDG